MTKPLCHYLKIVSEYIISWAKLCCCTNDTCLFPLLWSLLYVRFVGLFLLFRHYLKKFWHSSVLLVNEIFEGFCPMHSGEYAILRRDTNCCYIRLSSCDWELTNYFQLVNYQLCHAVCHINKWASACCKSGVSLRARHCANWLALRTILPTSRVWPSRGKTFLQKKVQFKTFCSPVKTSCPPAENVMKPLQVHL